MTEFTEDIGVYALFKDKRLVYVGKSTHMRTRVRQHAAKGMEFDRSYLHPLPKENIDEAEMAVISHCRPPCNKAIRPDHLKTASLDAVEIVREIFLIECCEWT